ncbi:hypothetical protein [Embleya sp. NPDC005971]|uniref:hypothetical protein n=1 Tax=Embleya sp. NPDC005971 TaxID=3156724 RepID=UPI0033F17512
MSRRQHPRGRVLAVCAAGALAVTGIGACSSDGDDILSGASKRLNIEKFRQAVRPIGAGGSQCPLPFDVAAATAAIHLDGVVTPGDPAADGSQGWSDDEAKARDPYSDLTAMQRSNGVEATCRYKVGTVEIHVDTWAARRGPAINAALPLIQRDAGVSVDTLGDFATRMTRIAPQQVVPVGEGKVAAVRLNVDGPGEAVLFVSAETLPPDRIATLASTFAKQLD